MKEFFTIGEISKLFNINKKTLRYYDEIDLFKPSYVDKNNKYRYYSIDQFECLETIQYMKELGLTLNKIKYHLNTLNLTKDYGKNNKNYKLNINNNNTFRNIQILICEKNWVMISKANSPSIHFVIYHPKLRNAIENFITTVVE